jgi:hypothetical protein
MMKLPEIKKELKKYDVNRLNIVVEEDYVWLAIHTNEVGGMEDLDLGDFDSVKEAMTYAKRTATGLNKVFPTTWEEANC